MTRIPTPNNKAEKKLFHNEWINVYPAYLSLDKIHFWEENNRTLFTFERLCRLQGQSLGKISIEEITKFVAEQDVHKLELLADSISRNGVQVPLIIRDDGKLLDGNRRYFACQWLRIQAEKNGNKLPDVLRNIPVQVIRKKDLDKDETLERKILAEANFITDLKIPWPLDAQARAVHEYYSDLRKKKKVDHEAAVIEIKNVFGIKVQRVNDFLDTLKLTKEFIEEGKTVDDRLRLRAIVEDKFVYFWEFLNKALKGRGAYEKVSEQNEVKEMFFSLMGRGAESPIVNVKQIEPLFQAKREPMIWALLKESNGLKASLVVSLMNEKKEVGKGEEKIRLFLIWLKVADDLTPQAKKYLLEISTLAAKKAGK